MLRSVIFKMPTHANSHHLASSRPFLILTAFSLTCCELELVDQSLRYRSREEGGRFVPNNQVVDVEMAVCYIHGSAC